MPLAAGQVLANRYRILARLGHSHFGTVYRAWDPSLNRPCAVCAVREGPAATLAGQQRFETEAAGLERLAHPHLPRVTDHFGLQGLGQFLVMDFVEGEDLQTRLNRDGPLPAAQAVRWIGQVAEALAYLHNQKPPIIHRDIKPANIRITPDGRAILVDFGLSLVFDAPAGDASGVTAGYSPPEQYGPGPTDARTDLYALGATLYALLTGQVPPESTRRQAQDTLVPAQQLNPAVNQLVSRVIERALALNPAHRFGSVQAFEAALLPALGLPREAATPTPMSAAGTSAPRPATAPTAAPVAAPLEPAPTPAVEPARAAPEARSGMVWGSVGCVVGGLLMIATVVGFAFLPWQRWVMGGTTPSGVPPRATVTSRLRTATPFAVAPATPTPGPATGGALFSEAFSDEAWGWTVDEDEDARWAYEGGEYSISIFDGGWVIWSQPNNLDETFADVRIRVTIRNSGEAEDPGFGVLCNYQPDDRYNYLGIGPDGYYGIYRAGPGDDVSLSDPEDNNWLFSDDIPINAQKYEVEVECRADGRLRLVVDGVEIAAATDDELAGGGGVGLFAASFEQAPVEIRFDHFEVWPLD